MLDTVSNTFDPQTEARAAEVAARPTRAQAEDAVRTLIRWAGDRPEREGLLQTPARVVRAYEEWFSGYGAQPRAILNRTFGEVGGYSEAVILRDIGVDSVCEHHMAAIRGVAHIGYLPQGRVVGISKLARVVEAFARRLQVQERLTAEIADAIEDTLRPRGVAVVIKARHECMSSRGVRQHGSALITRVFRGVYNQPAERGEMTTLLLGGPG